TRAFLPLVKPTHGSVVFFTSEAVLDGSRSSGVSAYIAAKSAVVAIMRSVADEGRASGIRANAVAPSAIRTATNEGSMGKDARYIEREDVAAVVAFLCSPESRALSGQVIRLR
ncbi:MAG: SDR family oxidoreductase, partial [Gemmatimonadota bacterium]